MRYFVILLLLSSACASPWRVSYDDRERFEEAPKIVKIDERYFIRFRYSDEERGMHFVMFTDSRIKHDTLLFFIPASTSSGYRKGVVQFEEIKSPKKIVMIEQKLVFWEGENRVRTPLPVEIAYDTNVRPSKNH